ncbi:MAG: TauD/TfdA family dioxygenase [Caulobacter sp.]|nr:TauD/TfdA family dioxygenase [Caulobacter sp.]
MGWRLAEVGVSAVRVKARTGGFGAEIGGVDLARGLSVAELSAVRAAFARHSVVWFRDQPLNHEQLEALSLQLGAFGQEPYAAPLPGHPHILEVRREPQETVAVFGGGWHSDWSFLEAPPAATLLHAKIIPPVGGDTLFADGAAAYETLPDETKRALEGLRAWHSATGPYGPEGYFAKESGRVGMTILSSPEADRRFSHPLVRTHPVTGRKSLFISPGYTVGVEGMDAAESGPLLASLFAHMTADRFVIRLAWAADTLTLWDNRCVLHHATGGYDGHRRVLHRTTLVGERPV